MMFTIKYTQHIGDTVGGCQVFDGCMISLQFKTYMATNVKCNCGPAIRTMTKSGGNVL